MSESKKNPLKITTTKGIIPDISKCKDCKWSKIKRLKYCDKHKDYIANLKETFTKEKKKCVDFEVKKGQTTIDKFL